MKLRIDELFLFVAENEEGEGLIGHRSGDQWIPFVCADKARLNSLRPMAENIARESGKKIKLIKFTTRTELEVIGE